MYPQHIHDRLFLAREQIKSKQYTLAQEVLLSILVNEPTHAEANYLQGYIFVQLEQYDQAIESLVKATLIEPERHQFHNDLANAYAAENQLDLAIKHYKLALNIKPLDPYLMFNLGDTLKDKGDFEEAICLFRKILEQNPKFIPALVNLGSAYKDRGDLDKGLSYYEQAFQIAPLDFKVASKILICLREQCALKQKDLFNRFRQWNDTFASPHINSFEEHQIKEPIVIGYCSAHLNQHSAFGVFHLIFKHHSSKFKLIIYSDTPFEDVKTEQLKSYGHRWRKTKGLSPSEFEALILKDNVDILVDLAGHTDNHRLFEFSKRLAPIQVTGLGYGSTSGLTVIDFRFSDKYYSPLKEIPFNSEKVVYLSSFIHWSPPDFDLKPDEPPFTKNGYITFGCGNSLFKLNKAVLLTWVQILKGVPNSVLSIKAKGLDSNDLQEKYLHLFTKEGIDKERLNFYPYSDHFQHLKFLNSIDIALDPFPLNGGISSCEILWMGVPIISMKGGLKEAESIMNQLNLQHLLSNEQRHYIENAIHLSKDIELLIHYRKKLRAILLQSSICNGSGFVRELEQAYEMMLRHAKILS